VQAWGLFGAAYDERRRARLSGRCAAALIVAGLILRNCRGCGGRGGGAKPPKIGSAEQRGPPVGARGATGATRPSVPKRTCGRGLRSINKGVGTIDIDVRCTKPQGARRRFGGPQLRATSPLLRSPVAVARGTSEVLAAYNRMLRCSGKPADHRSLEGPRVG
jgi:hypothetical protein